VETGFFGRDGAFQNVMYFQTKQLHIVPDTVDWGIAALSEPLAVAHKAVRVGNVDSTDSVVIIGDGSIGQLLLQVLIHCGALPACVVGASSTRLAFAKKLGVKLTWNVTERDTCEIRKHLESLGIFPTVVIEAAGASDAVPLAVSLVEPGGRIVLLGFTGGKQVQLKTDDIVVRELSLCGSLSSDSQDWRAVKEMMTAGKVQSIVTHTFYGLEQYPEALKMVRNKEEGAIKVQLRPNTSTHSEGKLNADEEPTATLL